MDRKSSLVILHLSDLHFGDKSRFAAHDPKDLASKCARDFEEECKRLTPDGTFDRVLL